LVACADIAIASEESDFAFTEVRLGLVPAVITVPVLRRMDRRAASELMLTGEVFDASRAADAGLVTRVTDDVDAELNRLRQLMCGCEPAALAETKRLLGLGSTASIATDFAAGLAEMSALSARYFASPSAQQGIAAFAGKRPPPWAR
jgi:enoyl-CoA hydratase/carnithine racemase